MQGGNVQQYDNNHRHLRDSLRLSPHACGNDYAIIGCDQPETADNKFPGNNDDNDPCREFSGPYQADHGCAYQQLVRQRIHKLSEIRDQVISSGNIAVGGIGQAGRDKYNQGDVPGRWKRKVHEQYEKRDHNHPQAGQFIWKIHSTSPVYSPIRSYSMEPVALAETKSPVWRVSSLCTKK